MDWSLFGADSSPVATVETHASALWFVGDTVFKLKKPVDFGFLDFSTPERRAVACRREVELNRRFAPDVYLGVAELVVDGQVVDHLVVMRRMPGDRRLSALAADRTSDVEHCVRAVGATVGAVHASARRDPTIDAAGAVEAVARHWEDDVRAMTPFVGHLLDPAVFDRVTARVRRFLAGRRTLFVERAEQGRCVDGHGDLQAADVFCLDDGPRILDCLEFDDSLRHGDVLADIGFLAMDLERLGRPDLVEPLVEAWAAAAGPHGVDDARHRPLLDHYIAYRAHVRAKVACLRWRQCPTQDPARDEAAAQARSLLELCDRRLDAARVRLVLVGGAPGAGKSTLATALSRRHGWALLRSDEARKQLAGLAPGESAAAGVGEGIYAADWTERTYAFLRERAAALLARGHTVVLDASWTVAGQRDAARAVAEDRMADLVELRLDLAPAEQAARVRSRRERGVDASDADEAVAAALAGVADPWPEATTLDASRAAEVVLADAEAALSESWRQS